MPVTLLLTEDQEGQALAGYLLLLQRMGRILLYSHIPHETYTKYISVKRRNTQQGLRRGVPDYIIVNQNKVIFIELKRTRKSTTSPEQLEWIEGLQGKTTHAKVCKGFDEAKAYIEKEIKLP